MSNLCPKKEVCGSCSLSDQPYETQLSNKLLEINKEFITNGFNPHVSKIIPSPKTSHYRNRMDFVISYQGEIGLRQKGKWWKVIDDHTCFISEEKLEQVFKLSRDYIRDAGFTYFDRKTFEGFLRYLAIRCTKSGSVLINIVTSSPLKNSDEEKQKLLAFCAYLTPKVQDLTIVWSINNTLSDVSFGEEQSVLVGSGFITETINGYSYKITPNSFFQTNSYAGEKLQSTVLEFLGDIKEKKILDLYCGSGFFTIPLAKSSSNVIGVEVVEEAVNDANFNAIQNNVAVKFITKKSEELDLQDFEAEYILIDPPRAGLHPTVLSNLLIKNPRKIVYVSCNYKSFVKEFSRFVPKYEITRAIAIDMFSHTPHVELVVLLESRSV